MRRPKRSTWRSSPQHVGTGRLSGSLCTHAATLEGPQDNASARCSLRESLALDDTRSTLFLIRPSEPSQSACSTPWLNRRRTPA